MATQRKAEQTGTAGPLSSSITREVVAPVLEQVAVVPAAVARMSLGGMTAIRIGSILPYSADAGHG